MNKKTAKKFFKKPSKKKKDKEKITPEMADQFKTELATETLNFKKAAGVKPKPEKKLTPKQDRFCLEYIVDLNGTQAAIRAGYSKKTAYSIAEQNLKKLEIQKKVQKLLDARRVRTEVKADEIIQEIKKMAFSNMADYMTPDNEGGAFVDLSNLTRDQAAAITQLEVESYWDKDLKKIVKKIKFKLADKYKGQELLGKHIKMFNGHGKDDDPEDDDKPSADRSGLSVKELASAIAEKLNKND